MGIKRTVQIYRCCKVCGKGDVPVSCKEYRCPVCDTVVPKLEEEAKCQ